MVALGAALFNLFIAGLMVGPSAFAPLATNPAQDSGPSVPAPAPPASPEVSQPQPAAPTGASLPPMPSRALQPNSVTYPNTLTIETFGEPTTLDPAIAYDDASGMVIQAVYETLIGLDRRYADRFIPVLAEEVPSLENGLISNNNQTYTFHIRRGVEFHSGDPLNASDVVYSLRRVLIIGEPNGPSWMLSQVLQESGIVATDEYTVRITLNSPYSAFLSILTYTVGSIVSEQSVEAHGGTQAGTPNAWMALHEDGTGPFALNSWLQTQQMVLDRAPNYWSSGRAARMDHVIVRFVSEYATRLLDLTSGDADIIDVPTSERENLTTLAQDPAQNISVEGGDPTWSIVAGAFNFNINTANRSQMGALPYPDDVPSDFFQDPSMRAAFTHAFDYADYLTNVTRGYATRLVGPIPTGMYGKALNISAPAYDLAAAQAAYNASLWVAANGLGRGFNLTVGYQCGNINREASALILKLGVEALGPNIHINAQCWDISAYLDMTIRTIDNEPGPVPVFFIGWGPDYADPDDYAVPLSRTGATYPQFTGFTNVSLDALIDQARATPNSDTRLSLYYQIQRSVVDGNEMIWMSESTNYHAERTWVRGWYHNPMFSGADLAGNMAAIYKEEPTNRSLLTDQVPATAFAGQNTTLRWDVSLPPGESPANITETRVYFDSASHGPAPYDRSLYPLSAVGVLEQGTTYSAQIDFAAPSGIFAIFYANVSGQPVYNDTEFAIDVRVAPRVSANLNLTEAFTTAGRTANVTVEIQWPYLDNLSSVALLWGLEEHFTPTNLTPLYTRLYATGSGLAGNYTFAFPINTNGRFFYAYAVEVAGVRFLSDAEYSFTVVAEPLVVRDTSPPWVFAGRSATVAWSVFADPSLNYTTELRWDTASHPSPRVFAAYPQTSGIRSGTGTNSYSQVIDTSSPTTIYFLFVVHWNAQDIYVTTLSGTHTEFRMEVRPEPLLTIPNVPPIAFVGHNVTVVANFTWAFFDEAERMAVLYDNAGHGSPPTSAAAYANEVVRPNVTAGAYVFTMDAPASPGTLYFAVHVRIGGIDILSANEYQVTVATVPVLVLTLPNWTLPQAIASATLAVNWPTGSALDSVALHYDTASHGGSLDPASYASSTAAQSGVPGTFSFTFNTANTPGTMYVLAAVEISTYLFTTAAEAPLPVADPPMVVGPTLNPALGFAIYGQSMEVSWTVNFTYAVQVASDFRWDTSSHAGPGMSFSDYPQASALLTQLSTTTFTTTFVAPNATGPIHGIVRVLLLGRNFYSAQEVNVTVLPTPVLELVSYPHQVDVGKPIEIAWRVNMTGPYTLIPHTSIHWGLVSKAPLPPLLTNYPGVGSPYGGIHSATFNTTLPSQPSPGHVYFIVHVVVNGLHYYLPDEYTIDVVLPGGGGNNGFLPGLDAGAALMAIAAVVFVAGLRRGPRRD